MASFIDQSVNERLQANGTNVMLNGTNVMLTIAGIHGAKALKTEKMSIKIKGLHSKVCSVVVSVHPSFSLGTTNHGYNKQKQSFH